MQVEVVSGYILASKALWLQYLKGEHTNADTSFIQVNKKGFYLLNTTNSRNIEQTDQLWAR